MGVNGPLRDAAAQSLLTLVQEHKERDPHDEDCGVVLFPLSVVYQDLVDRELTDAERRSFL